MDELRNPVQMEFPAAGTSQTPVWKTIPFAVGCPRCGADLRGRSDPVCPECSLTFQWSELIPLEELRCRHCDYHLYGLQSPRCPECGTEFNWESVLRDFFRSRKPLFEYQWRVHPLRSWMHTWWLALRPWRLWRVITLHDRPAMTGLVVMLIPLLAVFFLFPILLHLVALVGQAEMESHWQTRAFRPPVGRAVLSGFPTGWWIVSPIFHSGVTAWTAKGLLFIASGVMGTSFGLLILRMSMRRCKVKDVHVLRAVAYSLIPAATGWLVWHAFVTCRDVYSGLMVLNPANNYLGGPVWSHSFRLMLLALLLAICFWITLSLSLAYRRYIRMPHAEGVALAGVSIGVMAALLADVALRGIL